MALSRLNQFHEFSSSLPCNCLQCNVNYRCLSAMRCRLLNEFHEPHQRPKGQGIRNEWIQRSRFISFSTSTDVSLPAQPRTLCKLNVLDSTEGKNHHHCKQKAPFHCLQLHSPWGHLRQRSLGRVLSRYLESYPMKTKSQKNARFTVCLRLHDCCKQCTNNRATDITTSKICSQEKL